MSHSRLAAAVVAGGFLVLAPAAFAQEEPMAMASPDATPAMSAVAAADLAWSAVEIPGFLPGLKIAPVHGDPSVADEPYTLRLALPNGYKFPPHFHPRAENLTVLEGTLLLAMGEKFDDSQLKSYGVGDYLFIAGENPHFGSVKGSTVLQLHGFGPFNITVVEGQGMSP